MPLVQDGGSLVTFTSHKPSPSSIPIEKEKIQELQVQRALVWLEVGKCQNWCSGVTLSKGWIIQLCCTCSSSERIKSNTLTGIQATDKKAETPKD